MAGWLQNARVALKLGKLELSAYGHNLADKYYPVDSFDDVQPFGYVQPVWEAEEYRTSNDADTAKSASHVAKLELLMDCKARLIFGRIAAPAWTPVVARIRHS
jgi:hypothetical protein